MAKFELNTLYNQVFGYRGLPFPRGQSYSLPFKGIKNLGGVLKYNTPLGQDLFMPTALDGYQLPNEPTVSVSTRKYIVQTVLTGSDKIGTVKELISAEDYSITIRGIVLGEDDSYPSEIIEQLNELYLKQESLSYDNELLELLGIERLVLTSFNLPEMVGIQNAQAYEFKALSDNDFILDLSEE